jgi:hypothetical protein
MEHTQNTRKIIAAAIVLSASIGGLAACATVSDADAGRAAISHRMLVRENADRYVEELEQRADASMQVNTHRMLVRESADRYVDELVGRAPITHRELVRESAERYVDELLDRARAAE